MTEPQGLGSTTSPTFNQLGISEPVTRALRMRGTERPFEIQTLVIPDALAGRDVLARSRTGSGKTLAFAAPLVELLTPNGRSPSALILAPTRELASQVTEEFRVIADVKRLQIAAVYGGVGIGPQAKRARRADILVATPGRLIDLVTRILQMLRADRQTMLFSATLDGEVGRLAARFTRDAVLHEVGDSGLHLTDATHRFIAVEQPRKTQALIRELAADRGLTLVFVRTKYGADRLARNLRREGIRAGELHGGMSQPQRERALGRFASGANDVLVATDVAARGLDLDDITHVINFDAPADEKAYIHRVGRTARAGRSGEGVTFVTPQQRFEVGRIAKRLQLHAEFARVGGQAQKEDGMANKDKGGAKNKKTASKTLKQKREAKRSKGTSGSAGSGRALGG